MSNLDQIVKVNISINTPIIDGSSFDNLLIVGPPPTGENHPAPMGYYDLESVVKAGWMTTGDGADPVGIAARVAFSQNPAPAGVYIATRQETATDEYEPVADTLDRALATAGWFAICPAGIDEDEFESIAAWAETNGKLFLFTTLASTSPVDVKKGYLFSAGFYGKESLDQDEAVVPLDNRYLHVAVAAKCLGYSAGSETWAHKSLSGITPADLSSNELKALEEQNLTVYIPMASKSITKGGKTTGGEWIDVVRFSCWLQNDMQRRVANIFITLPKVVYTNEGIALVENQMIASLKAGQAAGGIAGDEYDADGALVPGFTVTVPNAATITGEQRASRILQGCQFTARLAGAIHMAQIGGSLNYE